MKRNRLLFAAASIGALAARAAKGRLPPLFATALLLFGCPEKTPQPPGDERLLAKLRAEKDREAREGPTVAPTAVEPLPKDEQVNPLAEFAAKGTQKKQLTLPAKTLLQVGKASLRLNALEATHTVGQGISVTTDDWFVMVGFSATAAEATELDLTSAHLERDGKTYPHARDAQAAGKRPGKGAVAAGTGDTPLTVWFEVPADALKEGLTFVMPDGAKLELQ
ncbi:MAG: hypothetical protein JNK82_17375 [Myxococcaceae bacterium]|nr:hypothetical protein [Myxococcaceae bacterium]